MPLYLAFIVSFSVNGQLLFDTINLNLNDEKSTEEGKDLIVDERSIKEGKDLNVVHLQQLENDIILIGYDRIFDFINSYKYTNAMIIQIRGVHDGGLHNYITGQEALTPFLYSNFFTFTKH